MFLCHNADRIRTCGVFHENGAAHYAYLGQYEVLDIATHSETLEPMVVYRPLYGEGKLWVRPASMWEEMVELDSKLVPRFTYLPKKYTNALSRLWYNGTEPEWEKVLAHYHTLYKDAALETFMEKLKPETVEQMSVSEFYQFLHDKYFVWKYTAKNRLATTRSHLRKYLDGDQLGEIHGQIFATSKNNSSDMLTAVSRIKGLGIAGASGLLSILFPEYYGTVDQFVVLALLTIDDLPEHDYLGKMNPELLSLKDGVLLEEIMRQKALELNQKFQTDRWTPRKIDMVLWAYDR